MPHVAAARRARGGASGAHAAQQNMPHLAARGAPRGSERGPRAATKHAASGRARPDAACFVAARGPRSLPRGAPRAARCGMFCCAAWAPLAPPRARRAAATCGMFCCSSGKPRSIGRPPWRAARRPDAAWFVAPQGSRDRAARRAARLPDAACFAWTAGSAARRGGSTSSPRLCPPAPLSRQKSRDAWRLSAARGGSVGAGRVFDTSSAAQGMCGFSAFLALAPRGLPPCLQQTHSHTPHTTHQLSVSTIRFVKSGISSSIRSVRPHLPSHDRILGLR